MARHRWTPDNIPDLRGRTAIVTGASSGLGIVEARELARAGAHVVLAVRNADKGRKVAAELPGSTEVRRLDLSSLASIRSFADDWSVDLDILINNAGIMLVPEGRTVDGFELQMGTNYLGAFALTNLLLPYVRDASTSRVVSMSSQLHIGGKIKLDNVDGTKGKYNALQAYRDSQLATVYFTAELQRRLEAAGSGIRAITAHPGIARTSLNDHVTGVRKMFFLATLWMFNDADHGAYPALYAATADVPGGSYVGPDGMGHLRGNPEIHRPGLAARDPELGPELWNVSARLTNTDFATV
ncbi:short-chain dehydrogenase [Planotetraspora thailandica]|uniref:Short-chain dehydrogenase n=1 Tax=Planotetraspora thailandica TaxID=487172 RepID=A0A8J3V0Q5_9ACTN|nr:oxidoreductase [Planotetraspora thailandica]GII51944.1 short-chain dehydrogenase [Planotetraspora thailandica]